MQQPDPQLAELGQLANDLARLRGVLDHSPALVYAKDLAGGSVFANRAALEALPARALGALGEADAAVIAGGSPVEADETLELDGDAVVHRTVRFPLTDAAGEPCGVCAVSVALGPVETEANPVFETGQLNSAKALLRRLETAVDAAQSALATGVR